MGTSTELKKDCTYYFEDGNCVLRVENYLFNLHRTMLRRNSVFFANMFSLPYGCETNQNMDGSSDGHPIVCGDTVEAFRAWCWALYAGFNEFKGSNATEDFDTETFAHIGLLAHKYECDTIEKWAQTKLDSKLETAQSNRQNKSPLDTRAFLFLSPPQHPSIRVLEYLIQTSTKCNWTSAKRKTENLLLETINSTPAIGVSNSASQLSVVLRIADTLNDNGLKAKAYYAFLRSVNWTLSPNEPKKRSSPFAFVNPGFALGTVANHVWWDSLDALTDAQKICLYRGFHGLSALRSQLRAMPEVPGMTPCRCLNRLQDEWRVFAEKGDLPDDPKVYLEMAKSSIKWSKIVAHNGTCGESELRQELNKFLEGFDVCLVNFFPS